MFILWNLSYRTKKDHWNSEKYHLISLVESKIFQHTRDDVVVVVSIPLGYGRFGFRAKLQGIFQDGGRS